MFFLDFGDDHDHYRDRQNDEMLNDMKSLLGGIQASQVRHQQAVQATQAEKDKMKSAKNNVERLRSAGKNEDAEKAIELYIKGIDKEIEAAPSDVGPLFKKGLYYFNFDKFEDAVKAFDTALLLNPKHINSLIRKTTALIKMGKFQDAQEVCDELARIDSRPEICLLQVEVYGGLDKWDEALEALDKFEKANPNSGMGSFMKADTLYKKGKKLDEALLAINRAIQKEPKTPNYYETKALILYKMEYYEDAIKSFDKKFTVGGKKPIAGEYSYYSLLCLFAKNNDASLIATERELKTNPNSLSDLFFKAANLMALDRVDEAYKISKLLIQKKRDDPSYHHQVANCSRLLGKSDESLAAVQEALKIKETASTYREFGLHYLETGNYKESIEYFDHALNLDEKNASSNFGKAVALLMLKDFDQGLTTIDKVIELKPKTPKYLLTKGMGLILAGKKDLGYSWIKKAYELQLYLYGPNSTPVERNEGLRLINSQILVKIYLVYSKLAELKNAASGRKVDEKLQTAWLTIVNGASHSDMRKTIDSLDEILQATEENQISINSVKIKDDDELSVMKLNRRVLANEIANLKSSNPSMYTYSLFMYWALMSTVETARTLFRSRVIEQLTSEEEQSVKTAVAQRLAKLNGHLFEDIGLNSAYESFKKKIPGDFPKMVFGSIYDTFPDIGLLSLKIGSAVLVAAKERSQSLKNSDQATTVSEALSELWEGCSFEESKVEAAEFGRVGYAEALMSFILIIESGIENGNLNQELRKSVLMSESEWKSRKETQRKLQEEQVKENEEMRVRMIRPHQKKKGGCCEIF